MTTYAGLQINNEIMLAGRRWKEDGVVQESLLGKIYYDVSKRNRKKAYKWAKKAETDLVLSEDQQVRIYKNGTFTLSLDSRYGYLVTDGSRPSWRCSITTDDGTKYLIWMLPDELFNLLKAGKFTSGTCESKIWFGQTDDGKNLVCIDGMPEIEQAKIDAEIRATPASTDYDVGQVVFQAKQDFRNEVYLGITYGRFAYSTKQGTVALKSDSRYKAEGTICTVYLLKKPEPVHVYGELFTKNKIKEQFSEQDICCVRGYSEKKPCNFDPNDIYPMMSPSKNTVEFGNQLEYGYSGHPLENIKKFYSCMFDDSDKPLQVTEEIKQIITTYFSERYECLLEVDFVEVDDFAAITKEQSYLQSLIISDAMYYPGLIR